MRRRSFSARRAATFGHRWGYLFLTRSAHLTTFTIYYLVFRQKYLIYNTHEKQTFFIKFGRRTRVQKGVQKICKTFSATTTTSTNLLFMFSIIPYTVEPASKNTKYGINICNRNAFYLVASVEGQFNLSILRQSQISKRYNGEPSSYEVPKMQSSLRFDAVEEIAANRWDVPSPDFVDMFGVSVFEQGSSTPVKSAARLATAKTTPNHSRIMFRIHVHELSSKYYKPFFIRIELNFNNGSGIMKPFDVGPFCVTSRPMKLSTTCPFKTRNPPLQEEQGLLSPSPPSSQPPKRRQPRAPKVSSTMDSRLTDMYHHVEECHETTRMDIQTVADNLTNIRMDVSEMMEEVSSMRETLTTFLKQQTPQPQTPTPSKYVSTLFSPDYSVSPFDTTHSSSIWDHDEDYVLY